MNYNLLYPHCIPELCWEFFYIILIIKPDLLQDNQFSVFLFTTNDSLIKYK